MIFKVSWVRMVDTANEIKISSLELTVTTF